MTTLLVALFVVNSVAPVLAQPTAPQVVDPSVVPPRLESSYEPEANATRMPSDPYKVWPIQNDLPYYVRVAPPYEYYECNETVSKYPEAVPKPEEQMTCPPNQYPQKFLWKKDSVDLPIFMPTKNWKRENPKSGIQP